MIREIETKKITEAIKNLCIEANTVLPEDTLEALNEALGFEESPQGREILRELIKNAEIAMREKVSICQDTGFAVVFIELGQDVRIVGGDLHEAINEGVSRGYKEGYLRKSIVQDPFLRVNTQDNTPAIIHLDLIPGDRLKITLMPKGGGCENISGLKMFKPTAPIEEIKKFILEVVKGGGGNSCPPIIIGIGIGGTAEYAMLLAKKALLRKIGKHNSTKDIAYLEKELLTEINNLGIGPEGLGGRITALAVNIETYPCHIASLPVAVNVDCNAHRYKEIVI